MDKHDGFSFDDYPEFTDVSEAVEEAAGEKAEYERQIGEQTADYESGAQEAREIADQRAQRKNR